MAVTAINFRGKQVNIYSAQNELLARSTIVEYVKEEMLIGIAGEVPGAKRGDPLMLLIILSDGVFEFSATMGKYHSGTTIIALAKGAPKEGRSATRYTINQPAIIDSMIIASKKMTMANPIPIFVSNISATGVLFTAPPKFNLGAKFEYKLATGDTFVHMPATVVRMKSIDKDKVEYGCKFESRPNN